LRNKIKRVYLKVDPDGAVIHPTYEELVKTTNLHLDLTDDRTKARDIQIKKLDKRIKKLEKKIGKV